MKAKKITSLSGAPSQELVPLTDHLYTDFSIELLEERLETDPLLLSGLFDQITPFCDMCKSDGFTCNDVNCTGCYGNNEEICSCKAANADCFKM